jgi:hypothetical protein
VSAARGHVNELRQKLLREVGLALLAASTGVSGLSCGGGDVTAPTVGSLQIATATTGVELDPDGYTIQVDAETPQPIGIAATLERAGLSAGSHTVSLDGLAPNCSALDNPRSVTVAAGQSTSLAFAVTCTATAGGLTISVTTSGQTPDPNGYTIALDGGAGQPLGIDATLSLANLKPGSHEVQLTGVAGNCTLTGTNPRTVTVLANAAATVTFAVTCLQSTLRWQEMASGTRFGLAGVWGSSASDVYTVGAGRAARGATTTIFHYDGHDWQQQFNQDTASLVSVWGSSATDVWAIGSGPPDGLFLHFNGTSWSPFPGPGFGHPGTANEFPIALGLVSVSGSSQANVYAVGTYFDGQDENAITLHFDGTKWSVVTTGLSERFHNINDVHVLSPRNVTTIGSYFPQMAFFMRHFDGIRWTELTQEDNAVLRGVWASGPSDVFAVGGSESSGGFVLHFDGVSWLPMVTPGTKTLLKVWGTSGSDVYAVGDGILHYDGRTWMKISERSVSSVWGSSPTDVFVVGPDGVILHGTP